MKILLSTITLIFLVGCSNIYVDFNKNKSTQLFQKNTNVYDFEFYLDYNLFRYKSKIYLSQDSEKIYPINFEIKLPKKILYYEISNISDFGFYFNDNQVIFIKAILEPYKFTYQDDFVKNPQKKELADFIYLILSTNRNDKHDIREMQIIDGRESLMIKQGKIMVLLFNIKKDNINYFRNLVQDITLL